MFANIITVLRIGLAPVFVLAVLCRAEEPASPMRLPLVIFSAAVATDILDGMVARGFGQKTRLGTVLDPLADKFLITAAFVTLYVMVTVPSYLHIPLWVLLIIVMRDLLLVAGSGLIYLFKGYREFTPSVPGRITTLLQAATIFCILAGFRYSWAVWNTAAVFTIVSGVGYATRIGKVVR